MYKLQRKDSYGVSHGLRMFSMALSGRPRCMQVWGPGSANDVDRARREQRFVRACLLQEHSRWTSYSYPACRGLSRSANQSQWIGKSIQPWRYVSPRRAGPQHVDEQQQAKNLCARANNCNCRPLLSPARPSMFSMIAFDRSIVSIPISPTGSK
jgi:hypothetical protein